MNAIKILEYLTMVSNKNISTNLIMHIVVITALTAIFTVKNENIKKALVNSTLLLLYLSVSINAFLYGNPFHLISFSILLVITTFVLLFTQNDINIPAMNINTLISMIFIGFGLWYPEFVNASDLQLLLLSPVGIVPCPTLLVTIGLLNLSFPGINKIQYFVTLAVGMLFGIIGFFILKVNLDILLLMEVVYALIYAFGQIYKSEKILKNSIT